MEDMIRDPMWTFVGVAIALVAILTTIVLALGQRKKKRLSYEIVSNTELLGIGEEIRGKVKILYEENEVKNVHLLTVRFVNSGNEPIGTTDYERPVRMMVNDEATILTHEIVDQDPSNLSAEATAEGNMFSIKPLLLNPKDAFSIKTLISDLDGSPRIDGRVKGVKAISRFEEGEKYLVVGTLVGLILMGIGIGMVTRKETIAASSLGIPWESIGSVAIALGYLTVIFAAFRSRRGRKALAEILRLILPYSLAKVGIGTNRQQ